MKKDNKQRLFEMMERINPDFQAPEDNSWAIFTISYGKKNFVTQLSGGDGKFFSEYHSDVKYTDPKVLKFTLEDAKALIERNKSFNNTYGLVNNKGVQIVKGKYDNVWRKGRIMEDESEIVKPKLILPVGISGSGKSTWIKANTNSNTVVVSPDDIRRELTGNISDQSKNGQVWSTAFDRIASALNSGKNVILDATNIKSSDRKRLMNHLKVNVDKPFDSFAKIFNVNPEIAKQRVKKDIQSGVDRSNVPDFAIDRQYQTFVDDVNLLEPEGFKIIDNITENDYKLSKSNNIDWEKLYEQLMLNTEIIKEGWRSVRKDLAASVDDLTHEFGMLKPDELQRLKDFGLIKFGYFSNLNNLLFPIIGNEKYFNFNTFKIKAEEILG